MTSDMYGPPRCLTLPSVGLTPPSVRYERVGPLYFRHNPPVLAILRRCIRELDAPLTVVEIGPGNGTVATDLRARFGEKIARYFGLERDTSIEGGYERVASLDHVAGTVGLVIASHVIEHMPTARFFSDFLQPLKPKLARDAVIVVATPNGLAPASMFGDFTHVQAYAWYDLYALLRLYFEQVDVVRARYLWSPARVAWLLPRMLIARMLELDWCDEIICVGRRPRENVRA